VDVNQLQAFDQVVRFGSFSKATRNLDVAQPTISARIQTLEQEVGGALILRGGNKLELTDLGRSFLPYARQALTTLSKGIEMARDTAHGKRGRVVVGTLPTLAIGFFASTLAALRTDYPDISIIVHTGHNQQIAEMLYDGFVQVGLMTWPFFNTDLRVLTHMKEPLVLVAHHSHLLATRKTLSIHEVVAESHPFMKVDWSLATTSWQSEIVSGLGVEFEVPPQTAYELVAKSIGTALLTITMVASDLATGRFVELDVSGMPTLVRESALVCLKRHGPFTPALTRFNDTFQAEAEAHNVL
jgi:DNA-binding transcriptional LysR family regulator